MRGLFAAHDIHAEVTIAHSGAQIAEAARSAREHGASVIVAGGGDGTVNAVASELVGSVVALGVLPLGTLNHFARDAGIPLELEQAVALVARGHTVKVDVGEVNCHIFLNNSSLGLYPAIVHEREKQQRRFGRSKWAAALWATLAALRRFSFLHVHLTTGSREFACRTPFVFIGNNEYRMEGLSIGGRTSLDQGKLSLYIAHDPGRLSLLRFAFRALFGRLAQARDFDVLLVENMTIETRRRHLRVATDGEVRTMEAPLSYRVRHDALTIIAPG